MPHCYSLSAHIIRKTETAQTYVVMSNLQDDQSINRSKVEQNEGSRRHNTASCIPASDEG